MAQRNRAKFGLAILLSPPLEVLLPADGRRRRGGQVIQFWWTNPTYRGAQEWLAVWTHQGVLDIAKSYDPRVPDRYRACCLLVDALITVLAYQHKELPYVPSPQTSSP